MTNIGKTVFVGIQEFINTCNTDGTSREVVFTCFTCKYRFLPESVTPCDSCINNGKESSAWFPTGWTPTREVREKYLKVKGLPLTTEVEVITGKKII